MQSLPMNHLEFADKFWSDIDQNVLHQLNRFLHKFGTPFSGFVTTPLNLLLDNKNGEDTKFVEVDQLDMPTGTVMDSDGKMHGVTWELLGFTMPKEMPFSMRIGGYNDKTTNKIGHIIDRYIKVNGVMLNKATATGPLASNFIHDWRVV